MMILAIDTSCDETSIALTDGRRIIVNQIYSQILIHKKWGGVVPSLAKRAHEERIDWVIGETLKKVANRHACSLRNIDYIAVTYGPGLAVALEVGIRKAKELAEKYHKKIISVNHMEGHIYSCFAQNRNGNPKRAFQFPYIGLLVSGGHTELVLFKDHITYQILGETVDDAAGESLDKAAKMLGLGYPGGPIIEHLAISGDPRYQIFPRPMSGAKDLNFSFSGLKTAFFYHLKNLDQKEKINHLNDLAASFQEAVFDSLLNKLTLAMKKTQIINILVAGGVVANLDFRQRVRKLVKKAGGQVLFPTSKSLYGDNAAMIGIAAYYKAQKNIFVEDISIFERVPRLKLGAIDERQSIS